MLNNADDILNIDDRKDRTIYVEAWEQEIRIKAMSTSAVTGMEEKCFDKKGNLDSRQWIAQLIINGVVKEDGTPMFTDAHTKALLEKSPAALRFIADEVVKLNGLGESDEDIAKN